MPIHSTGQTLHAPGLSLQTRKQCPRLLYRICGQYTLLPKTLEVPVCVKQTSNPLYRGGCADVRKGEHSGQDVAIKVIRTYSNNELEKTINVCCFSSVQHTLTPGFCTEVLQRACDVEISPTSRYTTVGGCIHFRESICDGVGVDEERNHQSIREGAPRHKPAQTRTSSTRDLDLSLTIENHPSWLALLRD